MIFLIRDKLEDITRDLYAREGYYHAMYGKQIVEEYRYNEWGVSK